MLPFQQGGQFSRPIAEGNPPDFGGTGNGAFAPPIGQAPPPDFGGGLFARPVGMGDPPPGLGGPFPGQGFTVGGGNWDGSGLGPPTGVPGFAPGGQPGVPGASGGLSVQAGNIPSFGMPWQNGRFARPIGMGPPPQFGGMPGFGRQRPIGMGPPPGFNFQRPIGMG